ncbi:hypothetical protein E5288_WYG017883 [Bos mutus]|uniref:Uncharacterized protein n=1 Tax=Bos mutus TaxID=72004 RepID=A0A6B0S4W8_9CETA|nr:hypothetical protein [Bos mutus]
MTAVKTVHDTTMPRHTALILSPCGARPLRRPLQEVSTCLGSARVRTLTKHCRAPCGAQHVGSWGKPGERRCEQTQTRVPSGSPSVELPTPAPRRPASIGKTALGVGILDAAFLLLADHLGPPERTLPLQQKGGSKKQTLGLGVCETFTLRVHEARGRGGAGILRNNPSGELPVQHPSPLAGCIFPHPPEHGYWRTARTAFRGTVTLHLTFASGGKAGCEVNTGPDWQCRRAADAQTPQGPLTTHVDTVTQRQDSPDPTVSSDSTAQNLAASSDRTAQTQRCPQDGPDLTVYSDSTAQTRPCPQDGPDLVVSSDSMAQIRPCPQDGPDPAVSSGWPRPDRVLRQHGPDPAVSSRWPRPGRVLRQHGPDPAVSSDSMAQTWPCPQTAWPRPGRVLRMAQTQLCPQTAWPRSSRVLRMAQTRQCPQDGPDLAVSSDSMAQIRPCPQDGPDLAMSSGWPRPDWPLPGLLLPCSPAGRGIDRAVWSGAAQRKHPTSIIVFSGTTAGTVNLPEQESCPKGKPNHKYFPFHSSGLFLQQLRKNGLNGPGLRQEVARGLGNGDTGVGP